MRPNRRSNVVFALLIAGLMVLSVPLGCSGDSGEPATGGSSGGSDGNGGGVTTDSPGDTLDGQALVETKCSMCHTLDRVDGARKSREDWETTVSRMQGNGLVINAEERAAVIDYLSNRQ